MKYSPAIFVLILSSLLPTVAVSQLDFAIDEGVLVDEVPDKIWEGSFASGLNGKTGNSENVDINMNLNLTRKIALQTTKLLASYFYATNDVATTTDRLFLLGRHESCFSSRPNWCWFGQGTLEDDRFKSFDYQIGLHSGFVYKVFDEDMRSLRVRFGGGASRQVGGVLDDWIPELQFGLDWERKLNDRTKIYASADFFPNLEDFSDHRLITNSGFEFVIDEGLNLNFRIFAINRYDSTPEPGDQENDLDYGMAIVYGF